MYNYFMLIGVVYKELEFKSFQNGNKYAKIALYVNRCFKNADGQYDADLFHIYLWEPLFDIIKDKCHKGSRIAIKGRIQTKFVTLESKAVIPAYVLIGERILFYDECDNPMNEIEIPEDINSSINIEEIKD